MIKQTYLDLERENVIERKRISRFHPVVYDGIEAMDDFEYYAAEAHTNLPVKNGIVLCPCYILKVNGVPVPAYATRTTNGVHSFAYVDVESDTADFLIEVEISAAESSLALKAGDPKVDVLPLTSGVIAEVDGNTVRADICTFGSYTFVFNESAAEPLTLFVALQRPFVVPKGYKERLIKPGVYTEAETSFTEKYTVYRFLPGRYRTETIRLPSDCVLYFERGVYIDVIPGKEGLPPALRCDGGENVRIEGRGLFDFSECCGGETPPGYRMDKKGIELNNIEGLNVDGLTVINPQTWTLCINDCRNVCVSDCMIFGYRVYSDGIVLSDCKNAVVEDNFIRTGDDAFETKSTTEHGLTENVLFIRNAAWTDKAVAYGCIYESRHDTAGVRFVDCSVGFAQGTWSKHLGCCVIQMGDKKGSRIHDVIFSDIEIYATNNAMCNIYIGGSGGRGAGYGNVNDIHFQNIVARHAKNDILYIQTWDDENCFVGELFLDNIVKNGVKLTDENKAEHFHIKANYDLKNVHVNTKTKR